MTCSPLAASDSTAAGDNSIESDSGGSRDCLSSEPHHPPHTGTRTAEIYPSSPSSDNINNGRASAETDSPNTTFETQVETLLQQALYALASNNSCPAAASAAEITDPMENKHATDYKHHLPNLESVTPEPISQGQLAASIDELSVAEQHHESTVIGHSNDNDYARKKPKTASKSTQIPFVQSGCSQDVQMDTHQRLRSTGSPLPSPSREGSMTSPELPVEVTISRGRSQKGQKSSPPRPRQMEAAAAKGPLPHSFSVSVSSSSSEPSDDLDIFQELYYHDKLSVSESVIGELRRLAQREFYYPFHPDREYFRQTNVNPRTQPLLHRESSSPLKNPDTKGKALLHWYIALKPPARFGCPLEASPEAWDPREQRLIPLIDVIDKQSGFNNKWQRDMMAKLYIYMYYRHICEQDKSINALKPLNRLGVQLERRTLLPVVLVCTFCGQYSDLDWDHIELYDKHEIKKHYIQRLGSNPNNSEPLRIGILSVLTCNHPNCQNKSANRMPRRRTYSGRHDDEDFYCQSFTLKLEKGKHRIELCNILKNPVGYFPQYLGGEEEKEKWRVRALDENTVRYLRIESYMASIIDEYSESCRVCEKHVTADLLAKQKWTDEKIRKFAQKGNVCEGGICTWAEALGKTVEHMEQGLGDSWAEMVKVCSAMRRGMGGRISRARSRTRVSSRAQAAYDEWEAETSDDDSLLDEDHMDESDMTSRVVNEATEDPMEEDELDTENGSECRMSETVMNLVGPVPDDSLMEYEL
ncbi:hypothetical protein BDZ91DRAFT_718125 [Kalaharituber pfeilii]|nr:hypothetical protein BDZ91DRAFT_718125 [Kalaharituber pfeilii]